MDCVEQRGEWMEDSYRWTMVYWVVAVNSYGARYNHFKTFTDENAAWDLAMRVDVAAMNGDFDPTDSEYWKTAQPVYGSDCYAATGGDLEHHADLHPEMNPMLSEAEKHRVALEHDFYARRGNR